MAVTINGTTGIVTPDITTDSATVDTTTLVVDETNNRVGIGTSSPSTILHVKGANPNIRIEDNNETASGAIAFYDSVRETGRVSVASGASPSMQFNVLGATRATIDASGRLLINNTTLTNGYLNVLGDGITTDAVYIQQNNSTSRGLQTNCTASSFSKIVGLQYATRSNNSAYFFHRSYSSAGADQEFYVRGDGQVGADGSFFGGGADYAEYFEWSDGNTANEDRRGYTVVLDGNKVRKATDADNASQIIGAVSSRPSVVGDADMDAWKDKYLRDDFGSYITETHNVIEFTDGDGIERSYESHRVPDDVIVPDDATIKTEDEDGNPFTHRKLNPDYDESLAYVAREDRPEWDAIGMMGKLRIRKGQPVGDRWIKMRDISDSVEEWLVR